MNSDDMHEKIGLAKVRDRAEAWLKEKAQDIEGIAGREATATERAVARLFISCELLTDMYVSIKKEQGEKIAQGTLAGGLGLLAEYLRGKGEDTRLQVQVSFQKVAIPERSERERPTACSCAVDMDGNCEACQTILMGFWGALGESVKMVTQIDMSGKDVCRPCLRRHIDPTLARFIKETLSQYEPSTAEAALRAMFSASQNFSAMPMPLTMKAWDDLMKS